MFGAILDKFMGKIFASCKSVVIWAPAPCVWIGCNFFWKLTSWLHLCSKDFESTDYGFGIWMLPNCVFACLCIFQRFFPQVLFAIILFRDEKRDRCTTCDTAPPLDSVTLRKSANFSDKIILWGRHCNFKPSLFSETEGTQCHTETETETGGTQCSLTLGKI